MKIINLCVVLIVAISISACGSSSSNAPQDPNAIYTMAAQTVEVKLTQDAASKPTQPPPTLAIAPPTQPPTVTQQVQNPFPTLPGQPQLPTLPGGNQTFPTLPGPGTIMPTLQGGQPPMNTPQFPGTPMMATPTNSTLIQGDRAKWLTNEPADRSVFAPLDSFVLLMRVRNVGTTTWTADYSLRWYGGQGLSGTNSYTLGHEVKPNEIAQFYLTVVAPGTRASYLSYWYMYNNGNAAFGEELYFAFTVQ